MANGLLDFSSLTPQAPGSQPEGQGFWGSPQSWALAAALMQGGGWSTKPTTLGESLGAGINAMQAATNTQLDQNLKKQQLTQAQYALKQEQSNKVADMIGSVQFLPADKKPAAYKSALDAATKLGLDTSAWPKEYTPDVDNNISSAMAQSLGAKALMQNQLAAQKAQADLALSGATLATKQQMANIRAASNDLPVPFPNPINIPQIGGGLLANPNTSNTQQVAQPQQASPQAQQSLLFMNPASQTQSQQPQTQQLAQPVTQPLATGLGHKGTIAEQTQKAKDWEDYKTSTAKASSNYDDLNNLINATRSDLTGSLIGTSPVSGYAREKLTTQGDLLSKDSNRLQLELIKNMTGAGVSRMDIPIVKAVQSSVPSNYHFQKTNRAILDKFQASNEISSHITPQIIQQLDTMGVRDRNQAQNIVNQVVKATGAFKPDGSVDLSALGNWQTAFNNILNKQTNAAAKPSQQAPQYSEQQLQAMAQQAIAKGANPEQVKARMQQLRGG